jgi:hypothetical protein
MSDLHELMTEFLRAPDGAHYETLRTAVVADHRWHPYAGDIEALQALAKEDRWAEMAGRFQAAMPSLMLSPEAHLLAAEGARRSGDETGAGLLIHIANLLLDAIQGTGDGTAQRPFQVTTVSDQYMVLWSLQKKEIKQTLERKGARRIDHFICTDGTEVCFDITDMHNRIGVDLSAFMAEGES